MKENKILLTNDGYNQFIEILNNVEKTINDNGSNSTDACESATGDGWHDNFSFESLVEDARKLNYQLNKLYEDKLNIKLIEDNYDDNLINVNDIVTIKFVYDDNDYEIENICLTGKYISNNNEITLNSPLGKCIYKKRIGSKLEYKVNDKTIKIEILNKLTK